MKLVLSTKAEKQLRKISKTDQIILAQKLRQIRDQKKGIQQEKLSGFTHTYRSQIGNYRIVYTKSENVVHVVLIAHRRDVYQMLKRIFG